MNSEGMGKPDKTDSSDRLSVPMNNMQQSPLPSSSKLASRYILLSSILSQICKSEKNEWEDSRIKLMISNELHEMGFSVDGEA